MFENSRNRETGLPPIPESELDDRGVLEEIERRRKELSGRLLIIAHHYQTDEIVRFADRVGDSLELALEVRKHPDKPWVVFCGVTFMLETADILGAPGQAFLIPDPEAGCFLADTARSGPVEQAWEFIREATRETVIPITYINSSARLKAFVGKNDGAVCTSSNAEKIVRWAFSRAEKLFFFPDQHLGRNVCHDMGIPLEKMCVFNPLEKNGGLSEREIRESRVILWNGYCSVHQGFRPDHVDSVRERIPGVRVIVHPECPIDVVRKADLSGSTSFIIRRIEQAPEGACFAVGTEINLVNRLNRRFPGKTVLSLSPYQNLCTTMYRNRPRWLCAILRSLENGALRNRVTVPDTIRHDARKALERMLDLS